MCSNRRLLRGIAPLSKSETFYRPNDLVKDATALRMKIHLFNYLLLLVGAVRLARADSMAIGSAPGTGINWPSLYGTETGLFYHGMEGDTVIYQSTSPSFPRVVSVGSLISVQTGPLLAHMATSWTFDG